MRGVIYRQSYQKRAHDSPPHFRTAQLLRLWEGISAQEIVSPPRSEGARKPEKLRMFHMWGKI